MNLDIPQNELVLRYQTRTPRTAPPYEPLWYPIRRGSKSQRHTARAKRNVIDASDFYDGSVNGHYFGISIAKKTAATLPRFSPQCVVSLPSAMPSPVLNVTSGLPSW
jgi:hypothetical protein